MAQINHSSGSVYAGLDSGNLDFLKFILMIFPLDGKRILNLDLAGFPVFVSNNLVVSFPTHMLGRNRLK